MKISCDGQNGKLWLSREKHINKVPDRLNMSKAEKVSILFVGNFKLNITQWLTSKNDKKEMKIVPYASIVGSLMYNMVCTKLDIVHASGVSL